MDTLTRLNPLKLGALLFIGLLIASSWLVMPYFVQGQQMLRNVGDDSRMIKAGNVAQYLTRRLIYTPDLEITATLASDEYFQYVDRASIVGNLRPDRNLIFFVAETIHRGDLPQTVPTVTLRVGEETYYPTVSDGPSLVEHHRLSVFSFPKRDENGELIDFDSAGRLRLYVANPYLGSPREMTFVGSWDTPYTLPEELKSRADITPVAMLALGAGLLSSVLTPCLLQLVVVFGGVIAGFTTVPGKTTGDARQLTPLIRRKIVQIAVAFVLGFTLLYALAGAVIGAVGHQAQLLFSEYSRMVAIVSGLLVILLGLWVGFRGTREFACRLPDRAMMQGLSNRDLAGTLLASMGYALGCTACFGGAIVATLIVYVGAIGSATIGAGIMLTFAVGVAIPFLLSAYYISRVDSILTFLARNSKPLSYASMAIIITFGLILVTDNFHTVSDMIYPYLGLS
ncbi:MAG: cytochrome c biogenesis CcdA family protein [Candidatus Rariloculaceae bacterium]